MIDKQIVYRCYSDNLMQYIAEHHVKYFLVAKDIKSNNV